MTTSRDQQRVFSPAAINSLQLRNRFIRAAAFEGMTAGGLPSAQLVAYHRQVAAGGAAMTTVAYAAVSGSARTYAHQLSLVLPDVWPGLRQLTDAVHREGAAASIQLGHCGSFANRTVTGERPLGPSVVFNTYGLSFPRKMTADDIRNVAADFARAARNCKEAGFDAVELHAGHGYLISQFLSPYSNRRRDRWGGDLEGRFRFAALVMRQVRDAVGADYPILVKMNLRDGFAGGLELDEAVEVARLFEREGADALVLSGGFVSKVPMYVMRGDVPFREFYEGQTSVAKKLGILLMGKVLVKSFAYRDNYFLEDSRAVRRAVHLPLVQVGGLRKLADMERICGEGFEFLALARPLIMEPDLVVRMQRGEAGESRCVPCNKCVGLMDKGPIRCPEMEQR